ncbi:MAG TPA: methyltransferase domain-containing protein [Polyangiaceae bacterium]|nr:methyltransferase domain-containing protein [Polyangiaceae bacterium]
MSRLGPVWSYWEGPCPALIELCLGSLTRYAQAKILDRQSFDALWCSDRDLAIDELYVAHRADFVRAHLLRHYGGVWIDADCVLLDDVSPLLEAMAGKSLGAFRQKVGGFANNFLAARADGAPIRAFYERIVSHLRAGHPIDWNEIGSIPLEATIAEFTEEFCELSREGIMPICWSESARFLEPSSESDPSSLQLDPDARCYMLSNHSLPRELREQSRSELVCSPTLLGAVLRRSLSPDADRDLKPSYRYWRQSGAEWSAEYARRKERHPSYHIAELMLLDYVTHHAPCRVLEWGSGTGRHLEYLRTLAGVQAFGFEQSAEMVAAGIGSSDPAWRAGHVALGAPTSRLPYADRSFDLTFTSEALIHTPPEDLLGRLAELVRVTRGHILHLESHDSWNGGFSPWHDGCWGHDLVAAYRALGLVCEPMAYGFKRQAPYRVVLDASSARWTWSSQMLSLYRQLEDSVETGFARAGARPYA